MASEAGSGVEQGADDEGDDQDSHAEVGESAGKQGGEAVGDIPGAHELEGQQEIGDHEVCAADQADPADQTQNEDKPGEDVEDGLDEPQAARGRCRWRRGRGKSHG